MVKFLLVVLLSFCFSYFVLSVLGWIKTRGCPVLPAKFMDILNEDGKFVLWLKFSKEGKDHDFKKVLPLKPNSKLGNTAMTNLLSKFSQKKFFLFVCENGSAMLYSRIGVHAIVYFVLTITLIGLLQHFFSFFIH